MGVVHFDKLLRLALHQAFQLSKTSLGKATARKNRAFNEQSAERRSCSKLAGTA